MINALRHTRVWCGAPMVVLLIFFVGAPVYWADPWGLGLWRSTGIVLGWAGTGLLLVSLLFMVREVRWVQCLGGLERMMRWHHGTGYAAYLLLLAHPVALAIDAWRDEPQRAWELLSPWAEGWPIWVGWSAVLVLMIGMACTLMPRLPYVLWRRLHALLGLGVVLGYGHVLLLGMDVGAVLACVVAVLLLFLRWRRVDRGSAARPYVVTAVQPVAPSVVELVLTPLGLPVSVRPGQFVYVAFFDGAGYHGCGEYHPFTVSAAGVAGQLQLGIKALGDCTRCMQSLRAGVAARVQGPFGDFLLDRPAVSQWWLAGGIGITPFLAVLRAQPLQQPVRLLYLFRHEVDAAFLAELQVLARANPLLRLETHASGNAVADLEGLLPSAAELTGCVCYLCGPPGLLAAARQVLGARKVPALHMHCESFDFR